MTETAVFVCNICNEPSSDICVACTKDACRNHRCERCHRCSDCCDCDIPLTEREPEAVEVHEVHQAEVHQAEVHQAEPLRVESVDPVHVVHDPLLDHPHILPVEAVDYPVIEEEPLIESVAEVHEEIHEEIHEKPPEESDEAK